MNDQKVSRSAETAVKSERLREPHLQELAQLRCGPELRNGIQFLTYTQAVTTEKRDGARSGVALLFPQKMQKQSDLA